MSDQRPEERIAPPEWSGYTTLHDDRVGMSAEQLLRRAEEAYQELRAELDVLHRKLPRSSEKRLRRTSKNDSIVRECIAGAKARITITRRSMEGKT